MHTNRLLPLIILIVIPLLFGAGCQVKSQRDQTTPPPSRNVNETAPMGTLREHPQGPPELLAIIATCNDRPVVMEGADGGKTYPRDECFLNRAVALDDERLCDYMAASTVTANGVRLRELCVDQTRTATE